MSETSWAINASEFGKSFLKDDNQHGRNQSYFFVFEETDEKLKNAC